jgi:predicted XRE-type DNA-binding protein
LKNIKIREKAHGRGVKMWEIAEALGIADTTFSRKLRRELPENEQEKILNIIEQLSQEVN